MKQKKQNILMFVLLQTMGKASTAIATQDNNILDLLKDALNYANEQFEKDEIYYSDLTPEEAEQEIKTLDGLYSGLYTAIHMLFNLVTETESNKIKKEYHRLIDNMEDLREGLELYMDKEVMQALDEISRGDYSNFISAA